MRDRAGATCHDRGVTGPGTLSRGERVAVVQVAREGYEHLRAFDDLTASLAEGLRLAGVDAEVVPDPGLGRGRAPRGRRPVVIGGHVLDDRALRQLPRDAVLYNHEQIEPTSMLPPERLDAYARRAVWDYSARNVAAWAAAGHQVAHVPVGWSPNLARIARRPDPDLDVLFYGSVNERRLRILQALERAGARVHVAFGVYGEARDDLIARARLVLNVQFYEARILEVVRLQLLLANGVPVVSESAPGMDAPAGLADACAFEPYERLVPGALALLRDTRALDELGARGRARLEALPWSVTLAPVLVG